VLLLELCNYVQETTVAQPVAHAVGNVSHHPHVPVWLNYAVTSSHCSVRETLFLPELHVSVLWILDVVSENVRTRPL